MTRFVTCVRCEAVPKLQQRQPPPARRQKQRERLAERPARKSCAHPPARGIQRLDHQSCGGSALAQAWLLLQAHQLLDPKEPHTAQLLAAAKTSLADSMLRRAVLGRTRFPSREADPRRSSTSRSRDVWLALLQPSCSSPLRQWQRGS